MWRRASASTVAVAAVGKFNIIDTPKSTEGGWRRNISDDAKRVDGSRGLVNSGEKKGSVAAEVTPRQSNQVFITVFYPRLLAAYCLNPSSDDLPGDLSASNVTMYRSLLYSLSSYYPDVILIDLQRKPNVPVRRVSPHTGTSHICLSPTAVGNRLEIFSAAGEGRCGGGGEEVSSWLMALIISLSRDKIMNRAAATSSSPSKQYLFKLLGALVPYSTILPPPCIGYSTDVHSVVQLIQSPGLISPQQISKGDSPNCHLSLINVYDDSLRADLKPYYFDADSILSGFRCPLGVVVSMAVKACTDPDHLVRVPAVSFLGLLSPEQWKALSVTRSDSSHGNITHSCQGSDESHLIFEIHPPSTDADRFILEHSESTARAHVTSVISSLLQACGDSMGTVRVAGFKAFGDGTLNGALSLSPLFTPVLTSEEMDRGGNMRLPVGESGLGELSLDTMLTCLRKGCIDTKLAVSLFFYDFR